MRHRKITKNNNNSPIKKPAILIIFFILLIAGLSVVKVAVSNQLSTVGVELENLRAQVEKYNKENTLLEEKILEASSLSRVSKEAKKMGLIETKIQVYITNQLPLAHNGMQ